MILSFLPCVCTTYMAASTLGASLQEIRDAQASVALQLKTGVVRYKVESSLPPLTAEQRAEIGGAYQQKPDQLESTLRINDLNTKRSETVILFFANGAGVWKTMTRDVRNLDEIAARENLTPVQKLLLDTSEVLLAGKGFRARLVDRDNLIVREDPGTGSTPAFLAASAYFGGIPDRLLTEAKQHEITDCTFAGHEVLCLTLRSDKGSYVFEIDPVVRYAFRRRRLFWPDGRVATLITAEDYRKVDGIYFPFRCEEFKYDEHGNIKTHDVIRVEEAKFNQPLPADALQLILRAGIQVHGPGLSDRHPVRSERVLHGNELDQFARGQSEKRGAPGARNN